VLTWNKFDVAGPPLNVSLITLVNRPPSLTRSDRPRRHRERPGRAHPLIFFLGPQPTRFIIPLADRSPSTISPRLPGLHVLARGRELHKRPWLSIIFFCLQNMNDRFIA
jgi:hypothetical protein